MQKEMFDQKYNKLIGIIKDNTVTSKGYVLSKNAVRLLNLLCSGANVGRVLIPNLGHGELSLCAEKVTAYSESTSVIKVVKDISIENNFDLIQKDFLNAEINDSFSKILLFAPWCYPQGEPLGNCDRRGRADINYIKKCLDILPKNSELILLVRQNFLSAPAFKNVRERILNDFSLEAVIYLDKVGRAIGTESSVLIIQNKPQTSEIHMLIEDNDADVIFNNFVYGGGFFVNATEVYDRFDANYYDPQYKTEREVIQKRDTVKICDIAEVFHGCMIPSAERKSTGHYLVIKPRYICSGSIKVNDNKRIFCNKNFVSGNKCILKKGDVLISLITNASWAIYDGDEDYAIADRNVAIIRGKSEYNKWLNLFFNTRTGIEYLESQLNFLKHIATFNYISLGNLFDISVPDMKTMQGLEKINQYADREAKVVSLFNELGWETKEEFDYHGTRFDLALFEHGNLKAVVEIKNFSSANVVNNAVLAKQLTKIKDCIGNAHVYLFVDNEIFEFEEGSIIQLPELPRPGKTVFVKKKALKTIEDSKETLPVEKNEIEEKSISDSMTLEIIARGITSLQSSIDRIEGRIIDIAAKLEQLSKQISGYQSLVEKQLELAVSPDEKERILHAFSEECVERIKREIDTNNASREYNTELQKLIHTFGQNTWEKMEDSSRSFLVSSKIAFNNLINIENNVDYSGVCLLVTKALEVEMSKRFGKNFIAYLKGKYRGKENYYQFPTALLNTYYDENNTPHKKPIRPKDFTLGKLPYVMCLFYTNGITDEQKENDRQKLIEYAKEKLFNEKTDEEILEILKDFAEAIEEVKKDYRNPSAHTNQVKRIDAEECFNLVIDVEKLLKRILDSFKS